MSAETPDRDGPAPGLLPADGALAAAGRTLADARAEALARKLAKAWDEGSLLPAPTDADLPADAMQACDIQFRLLALRGQGIAGWKIGSKSPDGPVQGAPLPDDRVRPSPATFSCAAFPTLALEVEVAFRFTRAFVPREEPYAEAEVLAGIGQMLTTIEIVSTRYEGWPNIDKRALLADLQNHGALVASTPVPYDPAYPYTACQASLERDGVPLDLGTSANPAGDPRRLLPWLVNHARARGIAISPVTILTTGSYIGMHFTHQPGHYTGRLAGLPPVDLILTA